MECPRCKLVNPSTAQRCDCGYDFTTGQIKESYLPRKNNTICPHCGWANPEGTQRCACGYNFEKGIREDLYSMESGSVKLTPEDRQRIYEEEKARIEIRKQVDKEEKSSTMASEAKIAIGCSGIFLFVVIAGLISNVVNGSKFQSSDESSSPQVSSQELPTVSNENARAALDSIKEQLKVQGVSLIESYTIEGGSAYIQLNPNIWNDGNPSQQRQLCDRLASLDIWRQSGLLNAWLYVYNTNVGRIGPNWSGGFEFKPALDSLK